MPKLNISCIEFRPLRKNTLRGFCTSDSADVGTKHRHVATFGNDTIGFIRVRKRHLKTRRWPGGPRFSASFDLVKAVRVNGKPRHKFVLGLGSQKRDIFRCCDALCWFWFAAIRRMIRHGLTEDQRRRLLAEMVHKGAKLPAPTQIKEWAHGWRRDESIFADIVPLIDETGGLRLYGDRHGVQPRRAAVC